ncbi:hypothetical protein TSUD_139510 [Trifolium subterraneum]|uniref:Reverse transcriptase zinc-binding domain-containing protein n=1 Tax=Trifolium subterraneum TaxID=3900 RepID=A0A2Z6NJ85_TRISU|nr:hypothetical protein TSUD_139510 [Trifolium subterraneum]
MNNTSWKVGSGLFINLWHDSWCGEPLYHSLNIQQNVLRWLPTKVCDINHDQKWLIPNHLDLLFPNLKNIVQKVILPVEPLEDQLCWNHVSSGMLTLKDAYEFKRLQLPNLSWTKTVWCKDVPPSRSLLVWRLMHDKIPTDEKLMERGCSLPSLCSLCLSCSENTFHLFFECSFAFTLWCWLTSVLDFSILKKFNVTIHPPKAPDIKEVIWHPPIGLWLKCNTDGASNNLTASCGGIFRNSNSEFICGFVDNIGHNSAYIVELCGAMRAIEIAASQN